jgi:hypothetical protein
MLGRQPGSERARPERANEVSAKKVDADQASPRLGSLAFGPMAQLVKGA